MLKDHEIFNVNIWYRYRVSGNTGYPALKKISIRCIPTISEFNPVGSASFCRIRINEMRIRVQ